MFPNSEDFRLNNACFNSRSQYYNINLVLKVHIFNLNTYDYRGSISPTFSRAFFARVFHTNVFFLVTFCKKCVRKGLVKSTPGSSIYSQTRLLRAAMYKPNVLAISEFFYYRVDLCRYMIICG